MKNYLYSMKALKLHYLKIFFKYDDAVMDVISAHQKQGFMAGFEIARQLMAGGKAA